MSFIVDFISLFFCESYLKLSTINKPVIIIIIIIIIITIIIINVGQIQFYFLKQPFADNLQNRCLKNFAIFT